MTPPEVDQELERLFAVARVATAPDADARARLRAYLSRRLAAEGTARASSWASRAWLGIGAVGGGVVALASWLGGEPLAASTRTPSASVASMPAVPPRPAPAPALPAQERAAPATPTPSTESPPPQRAEKATPSSSRRFDDAEELPLVRAMQQALRAGNPGQALALAAEHARRFPRGTLMEEREGVRAVASCQVAAAHARPKILSSFLQRFASSPYAGRVKAACQ